MLNLSAFAALQAYLLSLLAALAVPAGDRPPSLTVPPSETEAPGPDSPAEDPPKPANVTSTVDQDSLPLTDDNDVSADDWPGTCECESIFILGCHTKVDRCSINHHPECSCGFLSNSCACKLN